MKKRNFFMLLIATLVFTFGSAQDQTENLKIHWPESYKWKIVSNQEDKSLHMIELIPESESLEKWTIIGTMISIKGIQNVPMEAAMKMTFNQTQINAPKAKLTMIEKDETAAHPWIIFKIESPRFKNDKNPESQLYYIVQGKQSLYSNFVAIKEKELPAEFVQKWLPVFKASEMVE